jgi:hypothetical protein
MGKKCGQFSRMLLTYDAAFLALLLTLLVKKEGRYSKEACFANPIKKKHILRDNPLISYSSDINLLLTYYKLKDDWEDDHSFIALMGEGLHGINVHRLQKAYPEKNEALKKYLGTLSKLEHENCDSMDRAAEPFARIMEEIMYYEPACSSQSVKDGLRWIGYNLGKWIYVLDAYDDLEKDWKNKRYNVLLNQFIIKKEEKIEEFKKRILDQVRFNLTYCLAQASQAYDLLDIGPGKGVLDNIFYLGMPKKMEQILDKGSCENCEKSV